MIARTAALVGVTIALCGLAQPASAENRKPYPMTSNARVAAIVNQLDQFDRRQDLLERAQRYYVYKQQNQNAKYALRADRQARLR